MRFSDMDDRTLKELYEYESRSCGRNPLRSGANMRGAYAELCRRGRIASQQSDARAREAFGLPPREYPAL